MSDALPIPVHYIKRLEEENKELKAQIKLLNKIIKRWEHEFSIYELDGSLDKGLFT